MEGAGAQTTSRPDIDLGRQPRDLVDDALADARLRLTAQYGPDALDRFTPEQVETIWLSLLQGCIDEEWKARKTTDEGPVTLLP